jgi:transposase-like protein
MHDFSYDLPLESSLKEKGRAQMISFKGAHFPQEIMLMGVRWYVAYPLSYRHVEDLMHERGVPVDHATIQRWVVKYSPQLEAAFHRRKRPVWVSWRLDETYIRVKGEGGICIARWIRMGRRLIFCSRRIETRTARCGF